MRERRLDAQLQGNVIANDPTIPSVTGVESKYSFCHRHQVLGTNMKAPRRDLISRQADSLCNSTAVIATDKTIAKAQQRPAAA